MVIVIKYNSPFEWSFDVSALMTAIEIDEDMIDCDIDKLIRGSYKRE